MSDLEILLNDFLENLDFYWNNNQRQIKKTFNRVSVIKKQYGWANKDLVFYSLSVADYRILNGLPTIYVSSFGSSGSHLLQNVFVEIKRSIPLGEVYIAPGLVQKVQSLSDDDKLRFMESYHLIHCGQANNFFCNGPIINTVHKANLQYFSDWTSKYKSCFLLRNPIDLVISRTFRKGEYRGYLHPEGISDKAYLEENIRKTKRFYNSAFKFPYDERVKFEDMIENKRPFHESLTNLLSDENIESVQLLVDRSIDNGGKTNKFSGEKKEIPSEYLDIAKSQLQDVVLESGYSF